MLGNDVLLFAGLAFLTIALFEKLKIPPWGMFAAALAMSVCGTVIGEREFTMNPGDSLFVYTDGVAEASNAEHEFFGTGRLLEALNRDPAAHPRTAIENVKAAVDEFAGDTPQFDDITMLCLTYHGSE